MGELCEIAGGRLNLRVHRGQYDAWLSERRIVAMLAGTQGGKTTFGPHWLLREIRRHGPGDYLVVTPTFPLLELKLLPAFRAVFESMFQLGAYAGAPSRRFTFNAAGAARAFGERFAGNEPTRVLFGTAAEPESLESMTARAVWLDEAGQRQFPLAAWEAVRRRVALHAGRILITTSVYSGGWLKAKVFDRWQGGDTEIDVINFASTANPQYPAAEFERAQRDLPPWKFKMQYLGRFERPAGQIYDCFERAIHTAPRFAVPAAWPRHLGIDFGQQNTAATWWAEEPGTRRLYAYRAYHAGGVSVPAHVRALLHGERGLPARCTGGAAAEDDWRREFAAAGLPVREPRIRDVEVGIDRVYGALQRGELVVFDDLSALIEEFQSYSRALDAAGQPTATIEAKHAYHLLDSVRYIIGELRGAPVKARPAGLRDWYAPGGRAGRRIG